MRHWKKDGLYTGQPLQPAGIYWMLARLGLVGVIRWAEFHRLQKAFKGHGTVSRVNGSIVIDITEA